MRVTHVRPPIAAGPFNRSLRKLTKKNRFPSARADIDRALERLRLAPHVPAPPESNLVPGVGATVLKVRVRSSDLARGKSGSFRLLLVLCDETTWEWAPFLVYAKADRVDVARQELVNALRAELDNDTAQDQADQAASDSPDTD